MKIRSNDPIEGSRLGSMLDSNVEPQAAATFKLKTQDLNKVQKQRNTSLIFQRFTLTTSSHRNLMKLIETSLMSFH